jgi:ABC-type transport system substrate-binding protein
MSRQRLPRPLYALIILAVLLGACTPVATPTTSAPTEAPTSAQVATTAATEVPTEAAGEGTEAPAPTEAAAEPTGAPALEDLPEVAIRLRDQDMQQLDPAFISRAGDDWIAKNIYSGLIRWKIGTADIEPDLATVWEYSEDGLELTFTLREGVQFHNGYGEVTSEDVKFSFERIMAADSGSPFQETMSIIKEVQAPDPYTVKLILNEPSATLLSDILPYRPGYIVSKKAVEEMGAEQFGLTPIGSGPFVFTEWTPGVEVVLTANLEYYSGPPQIGVLRLLPIVDENAAAIALETGEISLAWLATSEAYNVLKDNPDLTFYENTSNAARYLWLDNTKEPLNNVLVRQALQHAIDRETISAVGFEGIHPALQTILMPTMLCYTPDVPVYEYDPDKARALLAEAGYPDGFSLKLLYSQRPQDQTISEMVQGMWADVGINLEIVGLEHGTTTDIRRDPVAIKEYDAVQVHFGRTADPDSFLIETFHSGAFPPGSNAMFYDQIDDLIDAGRTELDQETRCEIYRQIQEKIQADAPGIPIVNTTWIYAARNELKGLVPGANQEFWAYTLYVEE